MRLFQYDERIGRYRVLVQTRDLQEGAVTSEALAPGAVTTEKIADGAVNENALDAGSVTGSKIANGAVTTEKLSDGAVAELNGVILEMAKLNEESKAVTESAERAEQERAEGYHALAEEMGNELVAFRETEKIYAEAERVRNQGETARTEAEQARVQAELERKELFQGLLVEGGYFVS